MRLRFRAIRRLRPGKILDTTVLMGYWYVMRHNRLCVSLAFLLFVSGCAIQKKQAPQIATPTADALNVGTLVSEAQQDYIVFFQTVGAEEKQGALSPAQVASLNALGNKVRDILDAAGGLTQTYAATNNAAVATQITAYLTQAAQIYAQMYAQRAATIAANAATAAKAKAGP